MQEIGYAPKRQNVSINVRVGAYDVDLVPGKHQGYPGDDHSLYRRRGDTWTKTNVRTHTNHVLAAGRLSETRVLETSFPIYCHDKFVAHFRVLTEIGPVTT